MENYYMEETVDMFEEDDLLNGEKCLIKDDLFSEGFKDHVEDSVKLPHLDYSFRENTVSAAFAAKTAFWNVHESHQFVHSLYQVMGDGTTMKASPEAEIADNILKKFLDEAFPEFMEPIEIIRAKVNIMPRWDNRYRGFNTTPHIDMVIPHYVLIYYVNNTDGDTVFVDGSTGTVEARIEPKRGRCLLFKGDNDHACSGPLNHDYRIAINIPFTLRKYGRKPFS